MGFEYRVALNDPTGALAQSQASLVLANLTAAVEIYSHHIGGVGVLDIVLSIDLSGQPLGSGRSLAAVAVGALDGKVVVQEGAVAELLTGRDPNGSAPDIEIMLPLDYLARTLWLDPEPETRSASVEAGRFDAVSFFLHELGHALGFNGRGDPATGVVGGDFMSVYDSLVARPQGDPVFVGAHAMEVYGGGVPLSTNLVNDYTHYGRVERDGLSTHMMEGSAPAPFGGRWYLDLIDLAVFQDLGLDTVTTPIAAVGGSRFATHAGGGWLKGGMGPDTLSGAEGADTLLGGEGNDILQDRSGSNRLRGEAGDDRLIGGEGFDDLNGNLGADTIVGAAGNDWVRGGQGNDQLSGGEGDDWLSGDRGDDTLEGGKGADTFYAFRGSGLDRIVDFSSAAGDRVRLDEGVAFSISETPAGSMIDLGEGDGMLLWGVTLASLGDWFL